MGIAVTAAKLNGARTTVVQWLQHQSAGTLPLHMRPLMPEVQLTKDFAADAAGAGLLPQKYQETILANAIVAKQDNIKFLEASLTPECLYASMLPAITKWHSEILAATELPILEKNVQGELILTGWQDNVSGEQLAHQVVEDSIVYAFHVILIVGLGMPSWQEKSQRRKTSLSPPMWRWLMLPSPAH